MKRVLLTADVDGAVGGINVWARHIVNYWKSQTSSNIELDTIPTGRKDFTKFAQNKFKRIYDGVKAYTVFIMKVDTRLKKGNYDILHIASSASLGLIRDYILLLLAKKRGVKTVLHFHFGRIPQLKMEQNREWKWIVKNSKKADEVIVLDQMSLEALQSTGLHNVVKVPNPLSPEVMKYARKDVGIRKGILYVGQCYKAKGIFELVEACKEIEGATLKLVGSCSDEVAEELRTMAGNKTPLELAGVKPYADVLEEMTKCAVFVLPSYSEGFPNVILEAMACECAIVSTSVGAIPEIVSEGCGILVAPKDIQGLRGAIERLLGDEAMRRAFGKNATEKVKEYEIGLVWKKLDEVWK